VPQPNSLSGFDSSPDPPPSLLLRKLIVLPKPLYVRKEGKGQKKEKLKVHG